ncbi:MAG: alpha/beta hydrolase [bacterium]|nr:alpha/beta hydrolase [bacterium]
MRRCAFHLLLVCSLAVGVGYAQRRQRPPKPAATYANVSYGPHERNVLDFWLADSAVPTPLVVYIHGGGFRGGTKESLNAGTLKLLRAAGISVAAIHYRLVPASPLPAAHYDSRRALQFLRSKAAEWNIDKTRVGAFGGSAGAQICMYLAFHDEMADPSSADPLERESTRLAYVATSGGQATTDFNWWVENIPGYTEPHRSPSELYGDMPDAERMKLIDELAAFSLISSDDPPIHMSYSMAPGDPIPEDPRKASGWKVHHVTFGVELKKRMDALGMEADLKYPGANPVYKSVADFFVRKFGGE